MATRIKHVYGNVLRVAIPLDVINITQDDGTIVQTQQDFYPNTDYPTNIVLRKNGGISYTFDATVDGDVVSFEDMGTIAIGTYQVEVLCKNDAAEPMRYMVRSVIQIVDATAEAGIEAGVEFDAESYTLDGGIFLYSKGEDGRGIVNISVDESGASGGVNTVTITYTDGTTSVFHIRNGIGGGAGVTIGEDRVTLTNHGSNATIAVGTNKIRLIKIN